MHYVESEKVHLLQVMSRVAATLPEAGESSRERGKKRG
jgi:hypothetical protein